MRLHTFTVLSQTTTERRTSASRVLLRQLWYIVHENCPMRSSKDIHNDTRGIMLTIDARGSHGFKILALGGRRENIDINSTNGIILVNPSAVVDSCPGGRLVLKLVLHSRSPRLHDRDILNWVACQEETPPWCVSQELQSQGIQAHTPPTGHRRSRIQAWSDRNYTNIGVR